MKYLGTILALLATGYFSFKDLAHTYSTGAPAANTDSPGDGGATCNTLYCHSGPSAQSGEKIDISVLQPLDQIPTEFQLKCQIQGGCNMKRLVFRLVLKIILE